MLRFARELFSVRMDWLTLEINITPNYAFNLPFPCFMVDRRNMRKILCL